jgi:hypothetical protein
MGEPRKLRGFTGLQQAFDEVRFGAERTLNLRESLPTGAEATIRIFHELRRKGVVREFVEHTPGSFVVTVAPMSAMLDAGKRRREQEASPPPAAPPTLAALAPGTRNVLRVLAEHSLDALGVRERGPFLETEMLRLFGILAKSAGDGPDRELRFRAAVESAMRDLD